MSIFTLFSTIMEGTYLSLFVLFSIVVDGDRYVCICFAFHSYGGDRSEYICSVTTVMEGTDLSIFVLLPQLWRRQI